jgi:hypothetical protein
MLPFLAVWVSRLATLDHGQPAHPEWFNELLRKRAARHEALRREIAAFDTWAQNAEVHPDFSESLVAQANQRRMQLRATVEGELAILDRAMEHHKRVKRFIAARGSVDAAFPDPTGRMTTDVVSRVALLHTVEALSDEAAELGMPTNEIRSLQRDRG